MAKRTCPRDGRVFDSLTELLVHQTTEHDHTVRRLRTVSCRRCGTFDIDINVTRTCGRCGWVVPDSPDDMVAGEHAPVMPRHQWERRRPRP